MVKASGLGLDWHLLDRLGDESVESVESDWVESWVDQLTVVGVESGVLCRSDGLAVEVEWDEWVEDLLLLLLDGGGGGLDGSGELLDGSGDELLWDDGGSGLGDGSRELDGGHGSGSGSVAVSGLVANWLDVDVGLGGDVDVDVGLGGRGVVGVVGVGDDAGLLEGDGRAPGGLVESFGESDLGLLNFGGVGDELRGSGGGANQSKSGLQFK